MGFETKIAHYSDVIMSANESQITALSTVYFRLFVQARIEENIKAPRYWPLSGESTGDRWIPLPKDHNAKNVFTLWRHHDIPRIKCIITQSLHCIIPGGGYILQLA